MTTNFFRAGTCTYPIRLIVGLDASHLVSEGTVAVSLAGRTESLILRGDDAVDLVMLVQPSLLEGKHLMYPSRAWTLHNMVGHPGMHLLTLLGWHRLSKYVHDKTLPRPVSALDLSGLKEAV